MSATIPRHLLSAYTVLLNLRVWLCVCNYDDAFVDTSKMHSNQASSSKHSGSDIRYLTTFIPVIIFKSVLDYRVIHIFNLQPSLSFPIKIMYLVIFESCSKYMTAPQHNPYTNDFCVSIKDISCNLL